MNQKLGVLISGLFVASMGTASAAPTTAPVAIRPNLQMACGDGNDGPDPWSDLRSGSGTSPIAPQYKHVSGHAPAATAIHVIGSDEATVDANFAAVMEANFATASTEQILGRLSDKELAAIARHYQRTRGLESTPLLATFASRLSDTALVRVARAFNKDAVTHAVEAYAVPAVRAAYRAQVATVQPNLLPPPGEGGGGGGGGTGGGGTGGGGGSVAAAPTTDMTIEEIYLDFRTAPVGSLSPASAMSETALFASQRVLPAAAAGTAIGTGINYLITTYDPSLSDAIGGTIAGSIEAAQQAATEVERGHYQSAYDALFGYPVSDYSGATVNFDADWNVAEPMDEYYSSGGSCGW